MSALLVPALYGLLSAFGLVAGAVAGWSLHMRHRTIAATTAVGAGLLMATATLYLVSSALETVRPIVAASGALLGAALVSLFNLILQRWSVEKRKRCGECASQPNELDVPGSGLAIAFASVVDAVPESLILGAAAANREAGLLPFAVISALAMGNFSEGLSSAAGMRLAGRSGWFVTIVWGGASAITILAAIAGFALFSEGSLEHGWLEAVAAGALMALVIETMAPEAVSSQPSFSGLLAMIGFAALVLAL